MMKWKLSVLLLLTGIGVILTSCSEDDGYQPSPAPITPHTKPVQELIRICDESTEVRQLLQHSISQAAAVNPDRNYNPAQTLDEFFNFIDRNVRCLPWDVMIHPSPTAYGKSLYGRTDQGIGYFWFVVDQPLDELKNRGYFYPTVEYVEPFASWLSTYCQSWGDWLSTEESWNDSYYEMVKNDSDWGMPQGWYGNSNRWKTFNEFFSRSLISPDQRPIAEATVICPTDATVKAPNNDAVPLETWKIDDQNQLEYTDVQVKTCRIRDIAQLIGKESAYSQAFAGGSLTHMFLDVNNYHRYHAPVDGELVELRRIPGIAAGGGYTLWDNEEKLYYYVNDLGFQMIETRACAIFKTQDYGLVAMLPVGMSQICSVNWLPTLKVGQQMKRGDEMGFFQFGGSDIILLFQKDVQVEMLAKGKKVTLMGEALAQLIKKQ